MIVFKNVTKKKSKGGSGKALLFDQISFSLPEEKIALIGAKGSGKSTLLKLMCGMEMPTHGTVSTSSTLSWPLGTNLGFQNVLTGKQNVEFVCKIYGLSKSDISIVLQFLKKTPELAGILEKPFKSYSPDMKALLSFQLYLSLQFDYHLIDKVPWFQERSLRKTAQLQMKQLLSGSNFIYISQDINRLREICKSAILIKGTDIKYYPEIDIALKENKKFIEKHFKSKTKKPQKKVNTKSAKDDPQATPE